MIILGIDPAIRTTGYGVIRADNPASFTILDCGIQSVCGASPEASGNWSKPFIPTALQSRNRFWGKTPRPRSSSAWRAARS